MTVRRLSDSPSQWRYYLDGRRVSRQAFEEAHYGRRTDTYCSRMSTRKDGAELARDYHCIRTERPGL